MSFLYRCTFFVMLFLLFSSPGHTFDEDGIGQAHRAWLTDPLPMIPEGGVALPTVGTIFVNIRADHAVVADLDPGHLGAGFVFHAANIAENRPAYYRVRVAQLHIFPGVLEEATPAWRAMHGIRGGDVQRLEPIYHNLGLFEAAGAYALYYGLMRRLIIEFATDIRADLGGLVLDLPEPPEAEGGGEGHASLHSTLIDQGTDHYNLEDGITRFVFPNLQPDDDGNIDMGDI